MDRYDYRVNGETFSSRDRAVDAAVVLRVAFAGKAIGEDPDKTGYALRVPNSNVTFVAGQIVEFDNHRTFRAAPERGAPFA